MSGSRPEGVTVVLPSQLRELSPGGDRVELGACADVRDVLRRLKEELPAVHERLVTERGELRPHLNLFVGPEDIRWSGGLETPVEDGAEVLVLRSVSGG